MKQEVIIVGGGWAGLSAALTLLTHEIPVTVLEAAPQLGGRARKIAFQGQSVDNGQHLLLGGYHALGSLLDKLMVDQDKIFIRKPLNLLVHSPSRQVRFHLKNIPSPLHAVWGLLTARGLPFTEKLNAHKIFNPDLQRTVANKDISVRALLQSAQQGEHITRMLWEPLCLASLSTPVAYASSQIFLKVLHDVFKGKATDSDFMFAREDLSSILPIPATRAITQQGGQIHTNTRVEQLLFERDRCIGVQTQIGLHFANHVILAAPPKPAISLLENAPMLSDLKHCLKNISHESITTVYCQYPENIQLAQEMVGLVGSVSQWVFDRKFAKQPGLMAVVITGQGAHDTMDNQALINTVSQELNQQFAFIPQKPIAALVVREKQGAFSCRVGISAYRPSNHTRSPGLFLAGDYTQTEYPASLESAVQSGIMCANNIIRSKKSRL